MEPRKPNLNTDEARVELTPTIQVEVRDCHGVRRCLSLSRQGAENLIDALRDGIVGFDAQSGKH